MKILFIYNPVAGQLQIKNYLWAILNYFSSLEAELTVHATQKSKEAYHLIKNEAEKYDKIICSGGDGTLHEIINGMMEIESSNPLGYIPAGSVNDFAASLKLPRNMDKAARLTIKGKPKGIDVGKFNDKYFIYVAAFGVFTDVAYETTQEMKNILGKLAYFLQGIKSVASMKAFKVKTIVDGIVSEDEYLYGMVTNTLTVGSLYKLSNQNVELDDGLFEVTLVKATYDVLELSSIASYLLSGKGDNNLVKIFKTDNIEFIVDEPMPWTLDGEYGGEPKEVKIEVVQKAINIVCD
ncbi:MAG: diacylglycerol/lipid kinase family protein [Erysipelotrichaceae bacterium]|jgi:diacylglycerol kinase (ATP)